VSALFELQGAANTTSSALDDVFVAALDLGPAPAMGVVLPPLGRCDPPGDVVGGGLAVDGLGTGGLPRRDRAVVVAGAGDGHVAAVVDTGDLALRTVHGLDPLLGLVEVAGDRVPAPSRSDLPPAGWSAAVAAGQRVGPCRRSCPYERGEIPCPRFLSRLAVGDSGRSPVLEAIAVAPRPL